MTFNPLERFVCSHRASSFPTQFMNARAAIESADMGQDDKTGNRVM